MIDIAAIRAHISTDLVDSALERVRTAAISDMDWYAGELDTAAADYAVLLARRNMLLIDMVRLAITSGAVYVAATGQPGADATAYHRSWDLLLRKIVPAVVS